MEWQTYHAGSTVLAGVHHTVVVIDLTVVPTEAKNTCAVESVHPILQGKWERRVFFT